MDKLDILEICNKLESLGFIREISRGKYSVKCLVNCDEDFEEDSIMVRDRIKMNFEDLNCIVKIHGTYWLEIIFEDIYHLIDDCFILKNNRGS